MNYINVLSDFCTSKAGYKLFGFIGYIMSFLQIAIPVIIIIMGTIDLFKAMISQSPDDMKKSQNMLIKRLIYGVVIFFVPVLVTFVINMVNGTNGEGNICLESFSNPKEAMANANTASNQNPGENTVVNGQNCIRTVQMGDNVECVTQDLNNQVTEL